MTDPSAASRPIADLALLSDCHSTALIGREGAIEWSCLRRFDNGSTFARLLDEHGGHFSIRPVDAVTTSSRRYVGDTMILETTLDTQHGTLVLTDGFTMREGGAANTQSELLRRATCRRGAVEVRIDLTPRFDYGAVHPWIRHHADGRVSAVGGDDAIVVQATVALDIDHEAARISAVRTLSVGQSIDMVLVAQPAHLLAPERADVDDFQRRLDQTLAWWTTWSAETAADGEYAPLIRRSALVLKSLCCGPTGAIIAAPTTSLPEIPGGSKNWDYRFCWVRDASLTLDALAAVGHHEVAQGFRDFIMRSSAGRGDELQIMYGAYGERRLPELELGQLAGWAGSRPVRIGNGAATQTQLDVFGHLLDAAHRWHEHGADDTCDHGSGIDDDEWRFLVSVVDQAVEHRHDTDAGIWELRGPGEHYVHSKVMVWVAIDRGIRLVDDHDLALDAAHLERWRTARDEIRRDVITHGVHPDTGGFVDHYGSTDVDASLLKLPLVGFVDADDPRMVATVAAVRDRLGAGPDGMLLRFVGDGDDASGGAADGSDRHEGVFLLCSFWLVEVLALQGRIDEATDLFDRLCSIGNDVGLFGEEYDPAADELLGNFPQAFTHLGLIAAERRLRTARP